MKKKWVTGNAQETSIYDNKFRNSFQSHPKITGQQWTAFKEEIKVDLLGIRVVDSRFYAKHRTYRKRSSFQFSRK